MRKMKKEKFKSGKLALEEPIPIAIREDDKKLWIINGYRVWAEDYQKALDLADMIDRF